MDFNKWFLNIGADTMLHHGMANLEITDISVFYEKFYSFRDLLTSVAANVHLT
jgi:hypothetical protein